MGRAAASADWTDEDWASYRAERPSLVLDEGEAPVQRRSYGGGPGQASADERRARAREAEREARRRELLATCPAAGCWVAEQEYARDRDAPVTELRARVVARFRDGEGQPSFSERLAAGELRLADVDDETFTRSLLGMFSGEGGILDELGEGPRPAGRSTRAAAGEHGGEGSPRSLADVSEQAFTDALRSI